MFILDSYNSLLIGLCVTNLFSPIILHHAAGEFLPGLSLCFSVKNMVFGDRLPGFTVKQKENTVVPLREEMLFDMNSSKIYLV